MKKYVSLLCLLCLLSGCGLDEKVPDNMILTHKTVAASMTPKNETPVAPAPKPVEPSFLSKGIQKDANGQIIYPYFEMPYDIEADQKTFPYDHPDIVVGDTHYMTQINDWYMHFKNYHDKTVVIEGYFLTINGHYFIGRNGPTCPYCTGGYVDFEFNSHQDFNGYLSGDTWIRLYGILREGKVHATKDIVAPFYHLEAVKVEKIPYTGKGTIVD